MKTKTQLILIAVFALGVTSGFAMPQEAWRIVPVTFAFAMSLVMINSTRKMIETRKASKRNVASTPEKDASYITEEGPWKSDRHCVACLCTATKGVTECTNCDAGKALSFRKWRRIVNNRGEAFYQICYDRAPQGFSFIPEEELIRKGIKLGGMPA